MNTVEKLEIHELLSRSAYALDERDLDMLEACFAKDGVMSLRISDGDLVGPFDGRDAIMKLMRDSMDAQSDKRRHVASNIFFESMTANTATVISNLSLFSIENGAIAIISSGIYRDEVVKNGDRWEIAKRHIDLDLPY